MTPEERDAVLLEIRDDLKKLLAATEHALAGPAADPGPRKGWLRELIADLQRINRPMVYSSAPAGRIFG